MSALFQYSLSTSSYARDTIESSFLNHAFIYNRSTLCPKCHISSNTHMHYEIPCTHRRPHVMTKLWSSRCHSTRSFPRGHGSGKEVKELTREESTYH